MEGFTEDSEFGVDSKKVPCYGIKLTAEQTKLVEYKEIDILRIDGRTMFKIKDRSGKETGEYMIFVVFK